MPEAADPAHGGWYFAIQITAADGRRERVRRGGYHTAALATAARDQILTTSSPTVAGHDWTVARWLQHWLTTLPLQVRPSTATAYQAHVERYLIPYLGHHTLSGLEVRHVEAMFTAIAVHPARAGRPVTAATLQRIRATLRRSLNMAVREQLLQVNPARLVVLPGRSVTARNRGHLPG